MHAKLIESVTKSPGDIVPFGDCYAGGSPGGAVCGVWGGYPGFGCGIGWSPG